MFEITDDNLLFYCLNYYEKLKIRLYLTTFNSIYKYHDYTKLFKSEDFLKFKTLCANKKQNYWYYYSSNAYTSFKLKRLYLDFKN